MIMMTGQSTFARYGYGILFFMLIVVLLIPSSAAITLTPGDSGSSSAIANGDPVFIRGIATGHPQSGLQIWMIGYNYLKIDTVQVNEDNTYNYELKSSDTQGLASGQYYVVVQHPMMNGQFDIIYAPSSGGIINRQLGNGTRIFQITGPGSLQSPDAAYALVRAISNQDVDDSFSTVSFIVSSPATLIKPIGTKYVGDTFTISGSTNLAVGDTLMVEIVSSSFKPTQKEQSGEFSGSAGTVQVVPGANGYNRWSFDIDSSTFKPDEYLVKVSGITVDVTGSSTFTLLERPPATSETVAIVTTTTTVTEGPTTLPPQLPTTQKSPLLFPLITCSIALAAVARVVAKK
jgi:trimeric autotransporter adhesin